MVGHGGSSATSGATSGYNPKDVKLYMFILFTSISILTRVFNIRSEYFWNNHTVLLLVVLQYAADDTGCSTHRGVQHVNKLSLQHKDDKLR